MGCQGKVVKGQTTQDFVLRDFNFIQGIENHWGFLSRTLGGERMVKSDESKTESKNWMCVRPHKI